MRMGFREQIKYLTGKIALAAGAALLIAAFLPTDAGAVSVTTTFPLLAGTSCSGSINNSADPTDMPNGNFVSTAAFDGSPPKTKNPNIAPTGKKNGNVAFVLGFLINGTCASLNSNQHLGPVSNPCGQTAYGTGTYVTGSAQSGPGTVTIAWTNEPAINGYQAAPPGSDPFDGCTSTFAVYLDSKNTASDMVLTGTTGSCKMAGSDVTMVCRNINN